MRENHFETPQREHSLVNRQSKSFSDHSKKSHKINRKSLNAEFSAAAGDLLTIASAKDSTELSSIAEFSNRSLIAESAENFSVPLAPPVEPTSETLSFADLTPSSSSITTLGCHGEGSEQSVHYRIDELRLLKNPSIETQMLVKQLRESMVQVLNSGDVHSRSKKLLDAMVNAMVEEFYSISADKEWFDQLLSKKVVVVLLSFLLWVLLLLSAVMFSISGGQHGSLGARPT